jgi:alpha-tubulin suppressor-like RCC1 family protein
MLTIAMAIPTYRKVKLPNKLFARAVQCGSEHTCAILTDGNLYSWGCGANGQTGLGHYLDKYSPAVVPSLVGESRIAKIAVGMSAWRPVCHVALH